MSPGINSSALESKCKLIPSLVKVDHEIVLHLKTGKVIELDAFWLRDHCRCGECYDAINFQRKLAITDIPDDICFGDYNVDESSNIMSVKWLDGHESSYELEFLIKHQFQRKLEPKTEIIHWTAANFQEKLYSTLRISLSDHLKYSSYFALECLAKYGVVFIDGLQPSLNQTEFAVRQLFPVQKTFYGEMWEISSRQKDHSDSSYNRDYLGPHNDNTYFNDACGLVAMHCTEHSGSGGESFIIDGFQICNKLKRDHPMVYQRLCDTIITCEFIDKNKHHSFSAPIISKDPLTGLTNQIRYNIYDRSPFNTLPMNQMRQFYHDWKLLSNEINSPVNQFQFKLSPGTVMIIDNWRLIHGRQAYTGTRTIAGCYVSRTEYQSALRLNEIIE